jgi:hypothetical protein
MSPNSYERSSLITSAARRSFCAECGSKTSFRAATVGRRFDETSGKPIATFYAVCDAAGAHRVTARRRLRGDRVGGHQPIYLGNFFLLPDDRSFEYRVGDDEYI